MFSTNDSILAPPLGRMCAPPPPRGARYSEQIQSSNPYGSIASSFFLASGLRIEDGAKKHSSPSLSRRKILHRGVFL